MSQSETGKQEAWGGTFSVESSPPVENDSAPKPKFKFLKKGEGVYRRVHAYKFRKAQPITDSVSANVDLAAQAADETSSNKLERTAPVSRPTPPSAEAPSPLAAHVTRNRNCRKLSGSFASKVEDADVPAANGHMGASAPLPEVSRLPSYQSPSARLDHHEEDQELEEFKRLEKQIRREVGESVASLPDLPHRFDVTLRPDEQIQVIPEPGTSAGAAATSANSFDDDQPWQDGCNADESGAFDIQQDTTYSGLYHAARSGRQHPGSLARKPIGSAPSHMQQVPPVIDEEHEQANEQVADGCIFLGTDHPNSYVRSMVQKAREQPVQHLQHPQAPAHTADGQLPVLQHSPQQPELYQPMMMASSSNLHPHAEHHAIAAPPMPWPTQPSSLGPNGYAVEDTRIRSPLDYAPPHLTHRPVVDERVAELQREMERLKFERENVSALRLEMERASHALEKEREAFQRQQESTKVAMDAERDREIAALKKEKAALEKQAKALLSQAIPSRKERAEIEAMEAVVAATQKDSKAKDARHKLTVERLRRQIVTLQEQTSQMREELEWHEKALEQSKNEAKKKAKKAKSRAVATQTDEPLSTPNASAGTPTSRNTAAPPAGLQRTVLNSNHRISATRSTALPSSAPNGKRTDVHLRGERPPPDQRALPSHTGAAEYDADPSNGLFLPLAVDANGVALGLPVYHATAADMAPALWGASTTGHAPRTRGDAEHPSMDDPHRHVPSYLPQRPQTGVPAAASDRVSDAVPPSTAASTWGGRSVSVERKRVTWQSDASYSTDSDSGRVQATDEQHIGEWSDSRVNGPFRVASDARAVSRPLVVANRSLGSPEDTGHSTSRTPGNQRVGLNGARSARETTSDGDPAGRATAWDDDTSDSAHGKDENISADFNAGQLAEIAAIQAELSASRSSQQGDTSWKEDKARTTRASFKSSPVTDACRPTLAQRTSNDSRPSTGAPMLGDFWAASHPSRPQRKAEAHFHDHSRHTSSDAVHINHGNNTASHMWSAPMQQFAMDALQQPANELMHSQPLATAVARAVHKAVDGCTRTVEHADGKVERWFEDGRREVRFANGTSKHVLASGITMVKFVNGDIKKTLPCGTVEYFYKEVDTWHTTSPSGVEVFYFPNGQTEAHHVDGSKEIIFPDGILRCVLPNGEEQDLDASALSQAVLSPKPQPIAVE